MTGTQLHSALRAAVMAIAVVACEPSSSGVSTPPAHSPQVRDEGLAGPGSATCTELMADRLPPSASAPRGVSMLAHIVTPDRSDRDGDGHFDAVDACPELPEDIDAFEDEDGCPDCDNDGDGVPDADVWMPDEAKWANLDTDGEVDCRQMAEDFDGDRDADGCPEIVWPIPGSTRCTDSERWRADAPPPRVSPWGVDDRDDDDVYDDEDACPELPEDKDGFEDEDGCPDCDNDGDGILDADVWTAGEDGPGWSNLDVRGDRDCRDDDGCPDPC